MAVAKDGQAPYAPAPAVLAVIDGFRSKHPRTPFDLDNIQLLDVSASLAPRTLQALRLLDLIDDGGEPTPAMVALREARSEEFPERLADVIRAAYSEVFAYRDPATQTPDELKDVFRFYRPPSQQDRMLRFFYGLCEAAGIIQEAPAIENASPEGNGRPSRTTRARATKTTGDRKRDKTPPPPPPPPSNQLPEIVAALVAKLPKKGEAWTAEDAKWWLEMAEMAFPREYRYAPKSKEDR